MGSLNNVMMHGQVAWRWQAYRDGRRNMHLDPTQHSLVTTEAEHHEIHEGHMWHYTFLDDDVDIAGPVKINLLAPEAYALGSTHASATHGGETYTHFAAEVYASGQVLVQFYEGATVSGGVAATPRNRNRDAGDTGLNTVVKTGVTATGGTLLSQAIVGNSGNPVQRSAGSARSGLEWVFAHEEDYTLVVTAAQDNTIVIVNMDFYEHIHKDDWDETLIQGV